MSYPRTAVGIVSRYRPIARVSIPRNKNTNVGRLVSVRAPGQISGFIGASALRFGMNYAIVPVAPVAV